MTGKLLKLWAALDQSSKPLLCKSSFDKLINNSWTVITMVCFFSCFCCCVVFFIVAFIAALIWSLKQAKHLELPCNWKCVIQIIYFSWITFCTHGNSPARAHNCFITSVTPIQLFPLFFTSFRRLPTNLYVKVLLRHWITSPKCFQNLLQTPIPAQRAVVPY